MNMPADLSRESLARWIAHEWGCDADITPMDYEAADAVLALVSRECDSARAAAIEECAKVLAALDELAVSADWDNSDDIAHAVKTACHAEIRALAQGGKS